MDLETDNLAKLKESYSDQLLYFQVDVRSQQGIQEAVADTMTGFRTLDIAIHNACRCTFQTEADTEFGTYQDVFDVNYFGALRFVKAVIPYMTRPNGSVCLFWLQIMTCVI